MKGAPLQTIVTEQEYFHQTFPQNDTITELIHQL